uniref:Transposase n=1 Tax=Ascaris lumbricoides TaxID=6252 RepID=A0A0M3HGG4_ASCLU
MKLSPVVNVSFGISNFGSYLSSSGNMRTFNVVSLICRAEKYSGERFCPKGFLNDE